MWFYWTCDHLSSCLILMIHPNTQTTVLFGIKEKHSQRIPEIDCPTASAQVFAVKSQHIFLDILTHNPLCRGRYITVSCPESTDRGQLTELSHWDSSSSWQKLKCRNYFWQTTSIINMDCNKQSGNWMEVWVTTVWHNEYLALGWTPRCYRSCHTLLTLQPLPPDLLSHVALLT